MRCLKKFFISKFVGYFKDVSILTCPRFGALPLTLLLVEILSLDNTILWPALARCLSMFPLLPLKCVIQSIFFRFTFKSVVSFDFFNVLTAQLTPYCYHIIPISLKSNNFFFSPAFKRMELHTAFCCFFSSFIILKRLKRSMAVKQNVATENRANKGEVINGQRNDVLVWLLFV